MTDRTSGLLAGGPRSSYGGRLGRGTGRRRRMSGGRPSVVLRILRGACICLCGLSPSGCQLFVDDADREVYKLIEQRQQAALGQTSDARIDRERAPTKIGRDAYSFAPNPVDADIPDSFRKTTTQPAAIEEVEAGDEEPSAASQPATGSASQPAPEPEERVLESLRKRLTSEGKTVMGLSEVLQYAQQHSRDYQFAKEDLYLSALALSLERHLWSPRFVGQITSQYANYGEVRNFDDAMDLVSQVAVEQRLPYGGEVTAKVISTLMRDLTNHVTTGETGAAILEANIPLLRGAGPVAYETRYQAERNLIYAVRRFEEFRRDFLVRVATAYFNLIGQKQSVVNAQLSYEEANGARVRAEALAKEEFINILDAQRAQSQEREALNTMIDRQAQYELGLDQFKILLGMPTTVQLELIVDDSEMDLRAPTVEEAEAIETALRYRLDLLNVRDRVGDAHRGVKVAENGLLPDLNFRSNLQSGSEPDHFNSMDIRGDNTTWRAFMDLELPLDRKEERNAYRSSLITLRRAERDYQEQEDTVKLEVRGALRRIKQERASLAIQELSIKDNELRLEVAKLKFLRGEITNRDVVEAINDLRDARDRAAQAVARYREAILAFRRDTGTLRVGEDGKWVPIESAIDSNAGNGYNGEEPSGRTVGGDGTRDG